MTAIFEEIKDYLESDGDIDAGITAHSYYSGNPEAVAFIAFLDELEIKGGWSSKRTLKAHCELVGKSFRRDTDVDDLHIVIIKHGLSVKVMLWSFSGHDELTHYFNPETKELLKLI